MKAKSFLLTVLATALFTGCTSEDGKDTDYPDRSLIGKAFLSLSLQSNTGPSTRADASIDEKPGSEDESKAADVRVLLFDNNDRCLGIKTVTGGKIGNSEGSSSPTATASDAIAVPADTKKVFVVINPFTDGWDFTEEVVKGKTWNEINTAIDATIDKVATAQKFMMASAGYTRGTDKSVTAIGALTGVTVHKPADYTDAEINKAKEEAKKAPAEVYVDRLTCKVTVSLKTGGVTKPANTEFEFKGWKLSVTNKSTRLYSDLVTYPNNTKGAVYRKDKNYQVSEQPDKSKTEALRAAFDYLENIDTDSEDMPVIDNISGANAYCLENTMEAVAQQLGFTTKVVVKADYTPNGISSKGNYFSWAGKYYTLDGLKTTYANTTGTGGLKTDLPIFLYKAGVITKEVFEGNQDAKDNAVAGLSESSFNEKTGIIGRFCAVRYYHASVCYYDILIRHDKNITQKMALGRWGVVRNNWYAIEIQNVTGPGTPWIPDPSDPGPTPTDPSPGPGPDPEPGPDPDDPYNPTPPDIDDDDNDVYLSVKITINPWTYWTQEAELH